MTRARVAGPAILSIFVLVAGCSVSFTTAHITSFTVGKDKGASVPANAFGPRDPVFAKVTVANNVGKVTLKWQLVAEKAAGLPEHNALSEADKSFDLNGDGSSTYTLTPPASGWPPGTYSVNVSMLDATGAEKDKRSATITVAPAPGDARESATVKDAVNPAKANDAGNSGRLFSEPEFSEMKQGDPNDTFAPDTPEIFMHVHFDGVANGSKVTATWIAEKVDGAPPETKIASADVTVAGNENAADFSMTKPTRNWPVGDYRVDLSVDGKNVPPSQFDGGGCGCRFKVENSLGGRSR